MDSFTPYVIDPLLSDQHHGSLLLDILSTPYYAHFSDPLNSASFLGLGLHWKFQLKILHWLLIVFSSSFQPLNSSGITWEALENSWVFSGPSLPRDPRLWPQHWDSNMQPRLKTFASGTSLGLWKELVSGLTRTPNKANLFDLQILVFLAPFEHGVPRLKIIFFLVWKLLVNRMKSEFRSSETFCNLVPLTIPALF